MNTQERLTSYYDFNETVIATVAQVAEAQNSLSFTELADRYNLANGPERVALAGIKGGYEYFRLKPVVDYDESEAAMYYAPMGTPADQNMAMRAIRLFACDPTRQMVVVGAPARIGNPTNRIPLASIKDVWQGKLTPVTTPVLEWLHGDGVRRANFIGYSYGATVAAAATAESVEQGIEARNGVFMEPATIATRSLLTLMRDFYQSGKPLQQYIDATESQPLLEARKQADAGMLRWAGGLLRLSNIALGHAQTVPVFSPLVVRALETNADMHAHLVWGGKSEMTPDGVMQTELTKLEQRFPERVNGIRLASMHHAGGDDIDLHAAMVLQALK